MLCATRIVISGLNCSPAVGPTSTRRPNLRNSSCSLFFSPAPNLSAPAPICNRKATLIPCVPSAIANPRLASCARRATAAAGACSAVSASPSGSSAASSVPDAVRKITPSFRSTLPKSSVDRKLGVIFLTASGTDDAAELPLGEAETAEQAPAAAVALRAQDAKRGFAIAEGTQGMSVAFRLQMGAGADKFGAGLKKSE